MEIKMSDHDLPRVPIMELINSMRENAQFAAHLHKLNEFAIKYEDNKVDKKEIIKSLKGILGRSQFKAFVKSIQLKIAEKNMEALQNKTAREAGVVTSKHVRGADGKMHLVTTLNVKKAEEIRAAAERRRGSMIVHLFDEQFQPAHEAEVTKLTSALKYGTGLEWDGEEEEDY